MHVLGEIVVHYYSEDNPYQCSNMIEGVVFDNDNTLYAEPENAHEYHCQAAVEAVQIQCPELDDAKIKALLTQSKQDKENYGGSLDIFAAEHGADMEKLRDDQYKTLIKNTKDNGFFTPEKSPQAGIARLRIAGINIAIATHGSRSWTDHTNKQVGLSQFFNEQSCVYKDDIEGHLSKSVSPAMVDKSLDMLQVPDTEDISLRGNGYVFVEDCLENLKFAHERGMTTVLIDTGRYSSQEIEDSGYVDVVVADHIAPANMVMQSNIMFEKILYEDNLNIKAAPSDSPSLNDDDTTLDNFDIG